MAKKLIATEISGLDPDTGELQFEYEEVDDGQPETTENEKLKQQKNFDGGDPSRAMDRYKAIQGWATKVHQTNLDMQRRLSDMEEKLSVNQNGHKQNIELPIVESPGSPNLDAVLSDPEALKLFIDNSVKSHLAIVGEYIQEQLEPYKPVLQAYNVHNELQEVVNDHPDFHHWQKEMLEISKGLPSDKEMTLGQLYHEARNKNPDKAMKIDSGLYNEKMEEGHQGKESNDRPVDDIHSSSDNTPGTESQAPGTVDTPAQEVTYDPSSPPKQVNFPVGRTATASELRKLADQHSTETGVADGLDPEPTKQGIDASIEAAWNEVTGSL